VTAQNTFPTHVTTLKNAAFIRKRTTPYIRHVFPTYVFALRKSNFLSQPERSCHFSIRRRHATQQDRRSERNAGRLSPRLFASAPIPNRRANTNV